MLEVRNLSKSYKKVQALKDISFSLKEKEITLLCGPNGAGKTTTLKCILSLLTKDSGEVLINGIPSTDNKARRTLAYVPETPDLYPLLTVWEHFKFIALAYKITHWEDSANNYLVQFNMTDKKNTLSKELSKGMKQKVSIIMSLIHNPDIFLIDEPFVGLDPQGIKEFRDLMCNLKELGKTLLVSTHILSSIEEISDRLIIMKKGEIIADGNKYDLQNIYGEHGSLEDLFFKITDESKVTSPLSLE